MRYTIPFAIFFIIEQIVLLLQGNPFPSIQHLFFSFIKGGYGKGSYYYPILLQLVFVFPLIFKVIKKKEIMGVVFFGVLNFAYEVLQSQINMPEIVYRILIFRYLLVISFGCYAAIKKSIKLNIGWVALLIVGIAYIISIRYLGISPIFTTKWSGTCLWACMYAVPIVVLIITTNKVRFKPIDNMK